MFQYWDDKFEINLNVQVQVSWKPKGLDRKRLFQVNLINVK